MEYIDDSKELFEQVKKLVKNKEAVNAMYLMKEIISKIDKYININDTEVLYTFTNMYQYVTWLTCFKDTIKTDKNIRWIDARFSEYYLQYGYILIELNQLDLAIDALEKSLLWNPLGIQSYFELANAYMKKGNMEKYVEYILGCGDKILLQKDLARYFRSLGYYYIEKEIYNLAISLYLISLNYEENPLVEHELKYIENKVEHRLILPDIHTSVERLKHYDIQLLPNMELMKKLYCEAQETEEKNLKVSLGLYKIVAQFITDNEIEKSIKLLEAKLNLKHSINVEAEKYEKIKIENVKNDNINVNVEEHLIKALNIKSKIIKIYADILVKLVIHIISSKKEKTEITCRDMKQVINEFLTNTKSLLISKHILNNDDDMKNLEKFYNLTENQQIEVIREVLFAFRKFSDNDRIIEL